VMARGHKIEDVPEMPLVVSDGAESLQKTKDAVALLKALGCGEELEKVTDSKKIRCGKGKARNRRYVMRKGPLVVYAKDEGITRAFRNIPGVDLLCVERLNLLNLAPGGVFGRFTIYTEGAIKRLNGLFGNYKSGSLEKTGYTLPRSMMTNTDIARIINSNEIQSALVPKKETARVIRQRKNPLKNRSVLGRLRPAVLKLKKMAKNPKAVALSKKKSLAAKKLSKKHVSSKKQFFKDLESCHVAKTIVME